MSVETYEWQSDFARKYVGIGREEGREEGRAFEAARLLISLLERRGFTLSAEVRERIESCDDLEALEEWVLAAAKVERPEDLFD